MYNNAPIRNNTLLQEAYNAGYYRALNEQGKMGGGGDAGAALGGGPDGDYPIPPKGTVSGPGGVFLTPLGDNLFQTADGEYYIWVGRKAIGNIDGWRQPH